MSTPSPYCIDADLLIPGRGEPLANARVLLEEGRIRWAGPAAQAPSTPEGAVTQHVPTVMPGMWDCHTHLTGLTRTSLDDVMRVPAPIAAARAAKDAEKALQAGFTSVREVGGHGTSIARVVDEGTIPGPNIYAAGCLISQTGGHADLHTYSLGCMADLAGRHGWLHLCDGEAECLRAVRSQLRVNAKLIKICASGGVLTTYDPPELQQFTDRELRTIVEEAERAERVVAAHCHGKSGIMAALEAGARTIEHATFLDEEAAERMRELDATLVPTRFVKVRMMEHGRRTGLPDYAWQKLLATADQHRQGIELAVEKGVPIALGTDTLTHGPDSALPWGLHGLELELLVEAGMTPRQAIEAATANAPRTVGPQAPRTGVLEAGHEADVLGVDGNPLDDVGILRGGERVTHVWKGGHLMKATR